MANFISPDELRNSVLNANVDTEYVQPAIDEAQGIYLREILGDRLYNAVVNKIESETLDGKYLTLVENYIKPYLTYMVQSLIVIPVNYKIRNAGVVNQYDNGFSTTDMKDTQYVKEYYDSKAQFYGNRLTEYLQKNSADIPEYGYSESNITQPTTSQNVTGIYLGTGRKRCNYTPTSGGGGGGQADSVEWNDILHKPQPTIGAGTVTIRQGETTQSFNVNDTSDTTIELSDGVTDYNELENTPDLSVYSLKADTYTKTEIDALTGQINQQIGTKADQSSLDTHTGNTTVHITAQERTSWNGKTTMADVEAKGYAVAADLATVATSGSYNDLSNTPNLATVATSGNYSDLNGTPSLATVATSGSYNDLSDKPAINNGSLTIQKNGVDVATFTANDSSAKTANITVPTNETDLGLTTEVWTFTMSDSTTVTKTVVIK